MRSSFVHASSSVSSDSPRRPRSACETALGEMPRSRASSDWLRLRCMRTARSAVPRRAAAGAASSAGRPSSTPSRNTLPSTPGPRASAFAIRRRPSLRAVSSSATPVLAAPSSVACGAPTSTSPASPGPATRRSAGAAGGGLGGPQPLDEHLEQRPCDLRVLLDVAAELALRDAPAAQVRLRRDVGRAAAAVDQRDLAEEVVPAEAGDGPARRAHHRLALGDDEEPRAGRAAADDRGAGVVDTLAETRGELHELRRPAGPTAAARGAERRPGWPSLTSAAIVGARG